MDCPFLLKELADSCSQLPFLLDLFGNATWASGQNGEEIPISLEADAGGMSFAGKAAMVGVFATAAVAVFWRRMRRSSSDEKYA